MIGTISRWGTRGYGFVSSDGLEHEAWLHAKFIDDPEYEPRQGDRVEFEPERLADGRYQARRVRPVDASGRRVARTSLSGSTTAYSEARVAVKLALPPALLSSVASPAPPAAALSAGPSLQLLPALAQPVVAPVAEREAAVVPAPPRADEPLGARLARARREREGDAVRLATEVAHLDEELARLAARRQSLVDDLAARRSRGGPAEESTIIAYLDEARAQLERGFTQRRLLVEAHKAARAQAITRGGLPTVLEYEDVRGRIAQAEARGDALTTKAFRALERERRLTLRELAEAADRADAAGEVRARFVAFQERRDDGPGALVVAAPLGAERMRAGAERGPLGQRAAHLGFAFWQAAERAAREAGVSEAAVEHGRVGEALAVRLPALDAGLLQLLLDEAWAARRELEGAMLPEVELVDEVVPPFLVEAVADEPPVALDEGGDDGDDEEVAPARGTAAVRGLAEVAARLGLSPRDLVALLCDRGLPFPDDLVDEGTEETLRALMGDAAPRGEADEEAQAPGEDDGDAADARAIAARMLRKLLRDRRVGGRHTRIENAYGHHFSDGEKDVARRVAEWLEKDGILLPKLNEGSHHISINPRRLRDVGQIVDGTWERGAAFDALA